MAFKAKIRTAKGSLTKVENYLSDENSDFSAEKVIAKLRILEPLFLKYEEAYYEQEENDDTEGEKDDSDYLDFQDRFFTAQEQLEQKLRLLKLDVQQDGHDLVNNNIPQPNHGNKIGIKTPKIDIGKFSGKMDDWIRFYESFKTIIHDNPVAGSNICKFHYLVSLLEGEAAHFINGIDISEENYEFAWEKLVNYYKNNKILAETHIANLFNTKKLETQTAKGLRELHNVFVKNLNALKKLGEANVDNNIFIVYLLSSKLDNLTMKKWEEETAATKEVPKFEQLERFLIEQYNSLESYERKSGEVAIGSNKLMGKRFSTSLTVQLEKPKICKNCNLNWHPLYKCQLFLRKSIDGRREVIGKLRCCWQCLSYDHSVSQCQGRLCSKCNDGKHSYLICNAKPEKAEDGRGSETGDGPTKNYKSYQNSNVFRSGDGTNRKSTSTHCATTMVPENQNSVIFPTCVIILLNSQKQPVLGRFLLDSASELNFMTLELADRLDLKLEQDEVKILGISDTEAITNGFITTKIKSRTSNFNTKAKFYVLPEVSKGSLLNCPISASFKNLEINIQRELADPEFHDSKRKIDGILGVGLFFEIFKQSKHHPVGSMSENLDFLHSTVFGWVVCGKIGRVNKETERKCLHASGEKKKITLEEETWASVTKRKKRALEDLLAEEEFRNSTKIESDGRFVVTLPFRENPSVLGNSYDGARRRFLNLERRFLKDPSLKEKYSDFINEYIVLGHMEEIPRNELHKWPNYYLPHHAVFRESSTTSLRVVFDASFKTTSGVSLNDTLLAGPALQNDVFNILTAFRFPKYGLTGDVAKMYRQIWVSKECVDFQRILWRESREDLLRHYRLKTVTYGTKSAPYLAIRCLHDIADRIQFTEPDLADAIKHNFFMDDYLDGEDTLEELRYKQSRMEEIFKEKGMALRKWCSNSSELMNELHNDMEKHYCINLAENDTIKTLGLTWNPKTDDLIVQVHGHHGSTITKRTILSDLQSFWDPIGLLSPALIKGRMYLQELWRVALEWDKPLPDHLKQKWIKFRENLHILHGFNIPRRVITNGMIGMELHGFSDASEKAYGACIYVRTWNSENNYFAQLLCAESHIAPLKETTLPRLELLGALSLARLMKKVTTNLKYIHSQHYWTDSEIVLAWIAGYPQQWNTYVANRVTLIQETTDVNNWHHVSSSDNPADIVSRGIKADAMTSCDLWWNGPSWLKDKDSEFPVWTNQGKETPEKRKLTFSLVCVKEESLNIFERFSSWTKLLRAIAWIFRFHYNTRSSERKKGNLTLDELANSKISILKLVQNSAFPEDVHILKLGRQRKKSDLLGLSPFLDDDDLLRVGGRILHANIPEAQKFPIILPYKSHVTEIIMREFHERHFHVGPQALLTLVRGEYWPLHGKSAAKSITRNCVVCRKAAPIALQPKMAALPADRVNPTRPFEVTGVDFCGPIYTKAGTRRSVKRKAYIALFVCFTTKAIHLELVTDLSSQAFLASLKRFFARRGKSRTIYSDNGTNFVGAQKELGFFAKDGRIKTDCSNEGIEWKFIPPGTPHFGGLWESSVKLTKFHLKRTMAKMVMTFEEAYTVLAGIEACLNSRPLTPLSDSPSDPSPLTPAHFLIGGNLNLPPEPDYTKHTLTRRWQQLKQFVQEFWKRWNNEYLSSLQQRNKWRVNKGQLKVGTLVAVKEENLKPTEWKMARVVALHPGKDGIARVATIIGKERRETKRPVAKLCPIFSEEELD